MFYYIKNNGISIDPCNMNQEDNGSIYYMTEDEMKSLVDIIICDVKKRILEKQEELEHRIIEGDKITAYGLTFTVKHILYQEFWFKDGYDCEFIDPKGNYHHWKQWEDNGNLLRWNGKQFSVIG